MAPRCCDDLQTWPLIHHFIHVERQLGQFTVVVESQPKLSLVVEPFASKRYAASGIRMVRSFIDQLALLVREMVPKKSTSCVDCRVCRSIVLTAPPVEMTVMFCPRDRMY